MALHSSSEDTFSASSSSSLDSSPFSSGASLSDTESDDSCADITPEKETPPANKNKGIAQKSKSNSRAKAEPNPRSKAKAKSKSKPAARNQNANANANSSADRVLRTTLRAKAIDRGYYYWPLLHKLHERCVERSNKTIYK